jgi:hypothetical protein
MVSVRTSHRFTISKIAFVILVILVPLAFGIGWNEHRRNQEIRDVVKDRRLLLIDGCERGNVIRGRLNEHIETTKEQTGLLIDYMRLDAGTKTPPLDRPERQAIKRLVTLYEEAAATDLLPIVNCQTIK